MADESPLHTPTPSPSHSPPHAGGAGSSNDPNLLAQFSGILQTALAHSRLEIETMMSHHRLEMEKLIDERLKEAEDNGDSQRKKKVEGTGGPHNHQDTPESAVASRLSYKAFKSCGATEFEGKIDPIEAFEWLDRIENAFEISFCEEQYKVRFAAARFTGQARQWWQLESESIGDERRKSMTWLEFKAKFIAQFSPGDLQRRYEREFLSLTQANLSVTQYAVEFQKKARFATVYVATEEMKVRRFVEGLRWEIRKFVLIQKAETLEKAMEYAREREEALAMKNAENPPPSSKRPNTGSVPTFSAGGSSAPVRSFPRSSGSQSV